MHARLDAFFARRQLESQDARKQNNNGPLFEASVSTFIDESEDERFNRHRRDETFTMG